MNTAVAPIVGYQHPDVPWNGLTVTEGSLFAGYGGLSLGVASAFARLGVPVEPTWFSEFDAAPSRILEYHWPDVPNYGDITEIDFLQLVWVAILTGGFPCQDVSLAGARRGLRDGTRSGLWAHFARAIDEIRPYLVVIENVRGLLSADGEPWHDELIAAAADVERLERLIALADTFIHDNPTRSRAGRSIHVDRWRGARVRLSRSLKRAVARRDREHRLVQRAIATVLRDLADLGYDAAWGGVLASEAGAPHGRFRVFILAWPSDPESLRGREGRSESAGFEGRSHAVGSSAVAPDAVDERRNGRSEEARRGRVRASVAGDHTAAPDAGDHRLGVVSAALDGDRKVALGHVDDGRDPHAPDAGGEAREIGSRSVASEPAGVGERRSHDDGVDTPADAGGATVSEHAGESPAKEAGALGGDRSVDPRGERPAVNWGPYRPAVERWEALTRPAPAPTRPDGTNGAHRLNPELPEWMMGLERGWITDPAIWVDWSYSAARNAQIKAAGNGVVPQQADLAVTNLLPFVPRWVLERLGVEAVAA